MGSHGNKNVMKLFILSVIKVKELLRLIHSAVHTHTHIFIYIIFSITVNKQLFQADEIS